jgi:integrase
MPAAELWPGWNRFTPSDKHREAVEAARLSVDIPLYNVRHAWAVRQVRAGVPIPIVQGQLGHSTAKLTLDTYAKFKPSGDDRRHWQGVVAADAERRKRVVGTNRGTTAR